MTASPERRYRRMLWAYPKPYRRRHEAEILTTLLEMAESGHNRPAATEMLHLVACGLRQRFRLPAARPLPAIAAVLAAIAMGALGAAGGTWLGWQTATPLPSGGETRALTAELAGGSPSDVAVYPWQTAMKGPAVTTRVTIPSAYSAERVRNALTSAGWRITTFTETTGGIVKITTDPYTTVPARFVQFEATKDGLSLTGDSTTVASRDVDGRTDVWADETAAVRPLAITGVLLGAVAGWLIAAALACRVRRTGRTREGVVAALATTAFAAAVVPVFVLYSDLYQVLAYDSGAPHPYVVDDPGAQLAEGLVPGCTGIGFLALAVAFLIARHGAHTGSDLTGQEPAVSS